MDGNGRWAISHGWPRAAGHRAGVEAVRRIVEAAPGLGIGILTLFAFSSDNWQRPSREVSSLFDLLRQYMRRETDRCVRNQIQVSFIGRRDRLGPTLRRAMEHMERAACRGRSLHLRLAVDYSARDAIVRAAAELEPGAAVDRESFSQLLNADSSGAPAPEVDLLIRTGGEQRLSDFLLWECAYAELYFTPQLWPDFNARDLAAAITDFQSRDRRFGRIPDAAAG
jgi:undecaprenyl diphosphate synthase